MHLFKLSRYFNSFHWRHNERDGVSNHQPHDCLRDCLFRHRSKKTSKLRATGLCAGNSPSPVNSPHRRPVTRKAFHLMTSSYSSSLRFRFILIVLITACPVSSWITRQADQCPSLPLDGCYCTEPRRPKVTCSGLGLEVIPPLTFDDAALIHTLDLSHNQLTGNVNLPSSMSLLQRLFLGNNGKKSHTSY